MSMAAMRMKDNEVGPSRIRVPWRARTPSEFLIRQRLIALTRTLPGCETGDVRRPPGAGRHPPASRSAAARRPERAGVSSSASCGASRARSARCASSTSRSKCSRARRDGDVPRRAIAKLPPGRWRRTPAHPRRDVPPRRPRRHRETAEAGGRGRAEGAIGRGPRPRARPEAARRRAPARRPAGSQASRRDRERRRHLPARSAPRGADRGEEASLHAESRAS